MMRVAGAILVAAVLVSGGAIMPPAPARAAVPSGRIVKLQSGGDLQSALDAAVPGDVIELPAGATFVGNFLLPNKPGRGWIAIVSSAVRSLPPAGKPLSPEHAQFMARIVSPNASPAIRTAAAAHHYVLAGLEVTTTSPSMEDLVYLDFPGQTALQIPSDIILYRCYIHGQPTADVRRGVAMNGARLAIIGSYVSEFHSTTRDSQAIRIWNGPGPFRIVGNRLEAAGENIMLGGEDPTIPGLVPSDVEIRANYITKPLRWKATEPAYAGIDWIVKNLLELKNARRVRIEGNVFEHSWVDDQDGFAVLFTVRNQSGTAPWSVVEDVRFANNVVRHSANGFHLLGWDDLQPSGQTKRIQIANNLLLDIGASRWGGPGRLFHIIDRTADVSIDHNTAMHLERVIWAGGGAHTGFVFTNNIVSNGAAGLAGQGTLDPLLTLLTYFPSAVFARNVLVGGSPAAFPPDNFFPLSLDAVGFVDMSAGDFRLAPASPFRYLATDGKDIGVDMTVLEAALLRWW